MIEKLRQCMSPGAILGFSSRFMQRSLCLAGLNLIYDKNALNEFGRIIFDSIRPTGIIYHIVDDINEKKETIIKFIDDCKEEKEKNRHVDYEFIFGSLMILAVDKTDANEKLTLICDFARMLELTDDEVIDIVNVVKFVYSHKKKEIKFNSEDVEDFFYEVL